MKRNSKTRVVVTGLGVVAPNAHGLEGFSSALKKGESIVQHIPILDELNFACTVGAIPKGIDEKKHDYFSKDSLHAMDESMIYSGIAAIDAWKDAGLSLPSWNEDVVHEDTGAILGTGIGGLNTFAEKVYPLVTTGNVRRMGSTMVEQVMSSSVSAQLAGIFALGNQVTTNSSACCTGTEAVIMGALRIRMGLAKRMIVGGAEGSGPYIWAGFDSLRVLNRKFNNHPELASRPMSASAAGFVPGSGAGILVIEDLKTALARGAKIYAEIIGTCVNSGGMRFGGSMTAPGAKGVQRCVQMAVSDAGIAAKEIDYYNGHLTATFADSKEIYNWAHTLKLEPEQFPLVNATKSLIGHTLGASGGIECVATLPQLDQGFVHGSTNCEDLHPKLEPFR